MTVVELAAFIAVVLFAVLAAFACVALVRLNRLLGETTRAVTELRERTGPLLDDAATTVARTGEQLDRVEEITGNVATSSEDIASVTALTRSVVTGPLVKVASFSYGLRHVVGRRRALAVIRTRRRRRELESRLR